MSSANGWLRDRSLRQALGLAGVFAAIKLLVHVAANVYQAHIGWGYYREELYWLVCGQHLAWGYVDQGPLVALQAKLAVALFGRSLAGIRMFSSLAGAGRVFLAGVLCWALGGRRAAQALAMTAVLLATTYFAIDSYFSMNSFESFFWMGCLLAVILIVRGGSERLWIWFGISAGLGMLNKVSISFFLLCLLLALLVRPERRVLASWWAAGGVGLMLLIEAPTLLWQVHNRWPTLEFLLKGEAGQQSREPALQFLAIQVLDLQPLSLLIWGAGLLWLLRARAAKAWRWIGLTYVFLLPLLMILKAHNYYLEPIYPVLFAAGGIAWERRFGGSEGVVRGRVVAFPWMTAGLVVYAVIFLPLSLPILRPATWERYVAKTHLNRLMSRSRNTTNTLPSFYADRFGWQEEVDLVSGIYQSLSPEDQRKVGILCTNYGEASAINFLGKGLPFAITGNENYFLWGPHGETGEVMIVIHNAPVEALRRSYSSVQLMGRLHHPFSETYEHRSVYLVRGRNRSIVDDWPSFKHY